MIDAQNEFGLLLRSRYPLVLIEGTDEERAQTLLEGVARKQEIPLFVWTVTRGLRRAGVLTPVHRGKTLFQALDSTLRMQQEALYLFKDLQAYLHEPEIVRRLLDLVPHFAADRRALVMTGSGVELPAALEGHCARWQLPLPAAEELKALAWRVVHDFSRSGDVRVDMDDAAFRRLIEGLKGLTFQEAERALCAAVADDLALTPDDVESVLEVKRRILKEGGVLEYVAIDVGPEAIGGLRALKHWLAVRRRALSAKAREFGLPAPKGIMLLGVQGCGKSLAAKTIAADWELPLLRLEAGRIYDKYVGESDKNLEQALRAAEHMAPCVLMIDEIEKAFAYAGSVDADGGLSRRIFGRLLTWLQERSAPVFLVATCNDVGQLPPELMRKGRFDEIFFIDLPDAAERARIFEIHLRRRHRDPASFDLARLAEASEGFSGAEIEQAVVSGLYAAFAAGRELDTDVVLAELEATRPLSVTRREEIQSLRSWAATRAVAAGGPAEDPA